MKNFLTILFRRKWHAVLFFIFMVGIPMTLAYIVPPKYEGKATLVLTPGREKKPFLPSEKDTRTSFIQVSMEDVGTEVELLHSFPVLAAAVDENRLDLDIPPPKEELLKYFAYMASKIFKGMLVVVGLKPDLPPREEAIQRLDDKLDTEFIRRTNVISVKYRNSSPELARDVVNSVVNAYLDHHVKVYGNIYALGPVKKEMDESYKHLLEMESRLDEYKRERRISNIESQREETLKKLVEGGSKERILKTLARQDYSTAELGSISGDPAFLELSSRLTNTEMRRIELVSRYGKADRKISAVDEEITQLKLLIRERLNNSLATWQGVVKKYQDELKYLDDSKIVIDRLKREIDHSNQLYQLNLEKYNEILISKNMDKASVSSVKVAEYAVLSNNPAFPRKMMILMASLFFGVFGGVAYAVGYDRLSGRIMSVSDIEALDTVPVLSSLPEYGTRNGKGTNLQMEYYKDLIPVINIIKKYRGHSFPKAVLFVSPTEGAGTSFIAENASYGLSRESNSSLIYVRFHVEKRGNEPGIEMSPPKLYGNEKNIKATFLETIDNSGNFKRLEIVLLPSEPDNLENGIRALLATLKAKYRFVVLDVPSPRAGMFYLNFIPYVDQIFLVAGYDKTSRYPLLRMFKVIERHGGKVSGCVLNRRQDVIPELIYNRLF